MVALNFKFYTRNTLFGHLILLKFNTQPNSKRLNLMAVFYFLFQTGNILCGQIWSKNQNCQLKLKYAYQHKLNMLNFNFKFKSYAETNSNMNNSMMLFTFSLLEQKDPFWANLVQKIKIFRLKPNFVPRKIQIWRIQCYYLSFSFIQQE